MKISIIILFFVSFQVSAQSDTTLNYEKEFEIITNTKNPNEIGNDEPTFIYVKTMPEFPGGKLALRRFIAENVIYPYEARKKGIQGVVFIRFEVKKNGFIGKVEIQKGVHKILDDESVRVVKSLPKFKPGMQDGKTVNVWFSIPITFKLN